MDIFWEVIKRVATIVIATPIGMWIRKRWFSPDQGEPEPKRIAKDR